MKTRIILLFCIVLGIVAEALKGTAHLENLSSNHERRNMDVALPSYLKVRDKRQQDFNDVKPSPQKNVRLNVHHAPVFVLDVHRKKYLVRPTNTYADENGAKKVVKKNTDPITTKITAQYPTKRNGHVENDNATLAEQVAVENDNATLAEPVAVENDNATLAEQVAVENDNATLAEQVAVENDNATLAEQVAVENDNATLAEQVAVENDNATLAEQVAVENDNATLAEQVAVENDNATLAEQVTVLTAENEALRTNIVALEAEVYRLKIANAELAEKNANLERENKILSDQLREANNALNDANRRLNVLIAANATLTAERDNLAAALRDTEDALKDAENKLANANSAVAALKSEMEQRLIEKDEEIESVRESLQRVIEELQGTVFEVETRYKSEIVGIKEKYATDIQKLNVALDYASVANVECVKQIKDLQQKSKELVAALEYTQSHLDDARAELSLSAIATELKDALLESTERARMNAETELADTYARLTEVTLQVTALTNDKRRMEADISAIQSDLDDALNGKNAAEERADRLLAELHILAEKLRQEQ